MSEIPPNTPQSLEAGYNLSRLKEKNDYSGRGVFVGLNQAGTQMVQLCWISGRGDDTRNRLYVNHGGRLTIEAADSSKVSDKAPLIFYDPMGEAFGKCFVVSNGDHTKDILAAACDNHSAVMKGLSGRTYEPDPPISTPRIAGVCFLRGNEPGYEIAMLRKSRFDDSCERFHWKYDSIPAGYGYGITTYAANGSPPPVFRGEPVLLPIKSDAEWVKKTYFDDALNNPHLVALAMKTIWLGNGHSEIHIWNRYQKVEPAAV